MNKTNRDIPEAELEVLSALWHLKEGTVRQVREELAGRGRELAHTTVLTLLGRLEGKGHVSCDRDGTANVYRSKISRGSITARRLGPLVQHLGNGHAAPLILHLMQHHDLTTDDLRQLRQTLRDLERENRAKKGSS